MQQTFFSPDETEKRLLAPLSKLRRDLHMHPELSGTEYETTERLRALFLKPPFEILPLPVKTGLVVRIKGRGPGKRIAVRADMDALPVTEFEGNPVRSETVGVMHACGHDMHMTFAYGAGLLLSEARERFDGEVLLIFQPSEENGYGAQAMIDAGLFGKYPVDCILGGHVKPELDAGKISVRTGPVMAALDGFRIEVTGKGGHGACPHVCRDPIVAAAAVVLALQTVVSRASDPNAPCVLSVCRVRGGETDNVIPDSVVLDGTLRTADREQRTACVERLRAAAEGAAVSMGCQANVLIHRGIPPVENDPALAAFCRERIKALLGADRVTALPVDTISEDFSQYSRLVPGCFIGIGTAQPNEPFHSLHSSRFYPSDALLPLGATVYAETAIGLLNAEPDDEPVRVFR